MKNGDWVNHILGGAPVPLSEMEARGLRSSGQIFLDGQEAAQTLQCSHCHKHWVVLRGSGRVRGWCHLCKGVTCGSKKCLAIHAPRDAVLDYIDGGKQANGASELELLRKDLSKRFPGIEKLAF